jgi:hypothetical protein
MTTKDLALRVAGSIFGIVALTHLLRILTGASVVISGWSLPIWVNYMGFMATAYLCWWLWWLSTNKNSDSSKYFTDKHIYP